jgi:hypothetical protein
MCLSINRSRWVSGTDLPAGSTRTTLLNEPIPGTTKLHRLEENIGAVNAELSPDDLRELDTVASKILVQERVKENIKKPRSGIGAFCVLQKSLLARLAPMF